MTTDATDPQEPEHSDAAANNHPRPVPGSREDVVERDRERLRGLEEEIEHARANAEKVVGSPGQRYVDTGTVHAELDDQTIAPPG